MQIVNTGNSYQLFNDHLKTYNKLPAQAYTVSFSPQSGYSLVSYGEIKIDEKVYGVHTEKVDKVLKNFNLFNRNLGVILSGDKGIGKSLFAKLLSIKAIEAGYPLIIVEGAIPGIASYLNSIEQEVVVLFDEFDKTFTNDGNRDNMQDPQTDLLTLFDGLGQGKKLFVVTCNDLTKLNSFLVNRPGRFHYHFRFEHPNAEQVREYLVDKIPNIEESEIQAVITFSRKVALNYDCLRAIAFELSTGLKFEDAIKDLNILNIQNEIYNIVVNLSDGSCYKTRSRLDMFCDNEKIEFCDKDGYDFEIEFDPSAGLYNATTGGVLITPDEIKSVDWETEYYVRNYAEGDEEKAQKIRDREKLTIVSMIVKRVYDKNLHYAV